MYDRPHLVRAPVEFKRATLLVSNLYLSELAFKSKLENCAIESDVHGGFTVSASALFTLMVLGVSMFSSQADVIGADNTIINLSNSLR